ncbi:MAG: hypothetical protein U5Q44_14290, partial [Dehalococcoidia bacterium]|nr:hypothetical protein [Dehalococcoidia bacterium]
MGQRLRFAEPGGRPGREGVTTRGAGPDDGARFGWDTPLEHLGRTQEVRWRTTLYSGAEAASSAIAQRACGVFIGDDRPLDQLEVPPLADESAAFAHETSRDPLGSFVDTVVCFRTGRVVHAVVQNGLDGTQDLEATLELARRKLAYTGDA